MACLASLAAGCIILRRRKKTGASYGLFETLRNYKPGRIYHWHQACAVRARGCTWTVNLPHDPLIFGTVDPAIVEHVLIAQFKKYDKGPQWRNAFQDFLGDGIFNADGNTWRTARKLASHEFSGRTLRTYMTAIFKERASVVLAAVRKACDAGEPIEVQDLFARYTLDSIGHIGFGVEIGSLENGEVAATFARGFDDVTTNIGYRFLDPLWKLKRALQIGSERDLRSALRRVCDFSDGVIRERRAVSAHDLSGRDDILSRFMVQGATRLQLPRPIPPSFPKLLSFRPVPSSSIPAPSVEVPSRYHPTPSHPRPIPVPSQSYPHPDSH